MPDVANATVRFNAKGNFVSELRKMGKEGKKFGKQMVSQFDRMSRRAKGFGSTMKGVLTGNLLTRATMAGQRAIWDLGETFLNVDDAITRAGSKFPEKIQRGTKAFYELRDSAREVGGATEFLMVDAAQGLDFLAMAGFDAKQSMAALPGVADLATVASTDLANASNIASDALTAFGLATKDPIQLGKNMARVNDVLAKTAITANTDINLMFDTLQYSGPVIKAAGQQIETFGALTGKMANASIKGTKAGTAIKNMFLRIQAPAAKGRKALRKLGITVEDKKTGDMRDMVDILGDMEKAMGKMGKIKKTRYMDAIFGKRAIVGASALFEQGIEGLRTYRQELRLAGGTSKEIAENIRGSLLNRLKQLKSALMGKGMDLIDAIMGKNPKAASKNLKDLIDRVKEFDVKPLAKDLRTLMNVATKLFKIIYRNRKMIIALGKAYIGFKLTMTGFKIARSIRDWGLLATNIAMAMSKAKGFGRLSAGLDAAMGGRTAAGMGAAGAPGASGKFWTQNVKSMSVLGKVSAVTFAAGAGIAIGTTIYETFIGPAMDRFFKEQEKQNEKVLQSRVDIFEQTKPETTTINELKDQQRRLSTLLDEVSLSEIEKTKHAGGFNVGIGAGVTDLMAGISDIFNAEAFKSGLKGETRIVGEANFLFEKMLQRRQDLMEQQAEVDRRISDVSGRVMGRNKLGVDTQDLIEGDPGMTKAFPNPMFLSEEYWKRQQQQTEGPTDQAGFFKDAFGPGGKGSIQDQTSKDLSWWTQAANQPPEMPTPPDLALKAEENREQLASALSKVIAERPIKLDVQVSGLPAEAKVTTVIEGAPNIGPDELGG